MGISARSALFTVGLSLATLTGSARALEIGPKVVVAGKSYDMPPGDLTSDVEAATRPRVAPRRTLIGDAAQALLHVRRDGLGQLLDPTHSRRSAHPGALNHTPSLLATKLTHDKTPMQ